MPEHDRPNAPLFELTFYGVDRESHPANSSLTSRRRYPAPVSVGPLRVWSGPLPQVDMSDRAARLGLNPIVRARLDDRLSATDRFDRYGSLDSCYRLVESPHESELALYPFVLAGGKRTSFIRFLKEAERHHLRTVVFGGGDLEPVMPSESVILLHPGPTRGAQPHADALALPYLFTDRAAGDWNRLDTPRASVAFCGQGAIRPTVHLAQTIRRAAQHLEYRTRPRVLPPPVRGHIRLRAAAINRLRRHPGVDDRFIVRDDYRAGVSSDADRARTQTEFDENLRSATYALCVRGTGNFSARFTEALSFGRIPLFVDTHCVLPLDWLIDWRSRCIWVDASDVDTIGDRLVAAHTEAIHDPLRSSQGLRELWENHLTHNGFFGLLPAKLRELI